MNPVKRTLAITMGITAAFAIGAARADDVTSLRTESPVGLNTAVTGESNVSSRISGDFTGFAGSSANASSLVTGLRRGAPVTLAAPTATGSSSTTFTPPTRPMGSGNVEISLALAQQRLASLGVTQPTPQQIRAALVGGTITTGTGATARTVTLPGVLRQRSQDMGWGSIARSQGTTLGHVISSVKRENQPNGTTAAVNHSGRIITASGETVHERRAHHVRDEHRIRGHEREMEDRDSRRFEHRERSRERSIENGVGHRFERRAEVRERGINGGTENRIDQRIGQRVAVNGQDVPAHNSSTRTGIVTAAGTPAVASGPIRIGPVHGRAHVNGPTAASMTASGGVAPSGIVNGNGAAVSTQLNVRGGDHGHFNGRVR